MRDSLSCNALVVLFSHAFVSLLISSFFYTASISASGCFPSNITYPQRAEFQLSSTNTHNKPFNFQIPLSCSPLRLTSSVLSPHPYFSTIFRPIRGKKEPAASNSTQLWSCLLNCTVANIVFHSMLNYDLSVICPDQSNAASLYHLPLNSTKSFPNPNSHDFFRPMKWSIKGKVFLLFCWTILDMEKMWNLPQNTKIIL